jgi:mono/diheme cytochrome c family protein
MSHTNLRIVAGFLMLSACGGEEAPPAPAAAPVAAKPDAPALKPWKDTLSDADLVKHGERIFMTKGSNTCNDCHGKDGKKGRLEQAANLTDPTSWDSTKAVGGDRAKVDQALIYLISNGGKKFNESYVQNNPDAGWDWSKTDGTSYDIQMFGVTQSSTMGELKKIRKDLKKAGIELPKDDLVSFGAKAVYQYVRSLSDSGETK